MNKNKILYVTVCALALTMNQNTAFADARSVLKARTGEDVATNQEAAIKLKKYLLGDDGTSTTNAGNTNLQDKINRLKQDKQNLKAQIAALATAPGQSPQDTQAKKDLENQLNALAVEKATTEQEASRLANQLLDLQSEFKKLEDTNNTLESERDTLKGENETLNQRLAAEITEANKKIEALSNQLKTKEVEHQKKVTESQTKFEKQKEALRKLIEGIKEQDKKTAQLKGKEKIDREQEIARLRKEVDEQQKTIIGNEKEFQSKEAELESNHKEALKQQQDIIETLETQNKSCRSLNKIYKNERDKANEKFKNVGEKTNETIKKHQEEILDNDKKFKLETDKIEGELAVSKTKIKELEETVKKNAKESEELVKTYEADNLQKTIEFEALQQSFERLLDKKVEQSKLVKTLQQQQQEFEEQSKTTKAELEKLNRENERLKSSKDESDKRALNFENTIKALNDETNDLQKKSQLNVQDIEEVKKLKQNLEDLKAGEIEYKEKFKRELKQADVDFKEQTEVKNRLEKQLEETNSKTAQLIIDLKNEAKNVNDDKKKEYQAEIDKLNNQIKASNLQLKTWQEKAQETLSKLEQEKKDSEQLEQEHNKLIERHEQIINQLTLQNTTLTQGSAVKDQEIEKLRGILDRIKELDNKMKADEIEFAKHEQKFSTEQKKQAAESNSLQEEIKQVEVNYEKQENRDRTKDSDFKKELDDLKDQIKKSETDTAKEIKIFENKEAHLQEEIRIFKQINEKLKAEMGTTPSSDPAEIKRYQDKISKLESANRDFVNLTSQLNNDLNKVNKSSEELENKLAALKEKYISDKKHLENVVNVRTQRMNEFQKEYKYYKNLHDKQHELMLQLMADLRKETENKQTVKDELENKVKKFEEDLRRTKSEIETSKNINVEAIDKYKKDIEELNKQKEVLEKESDTLKKPSSQISSKYKERIENIKKDVQSKNIDDKKLLDQITEENKSLKVELDQAKAEHNNKDEKQISEQMKEIENLKKAHEDQIKQIEKDNKEVTDDLVGFADIDKEQYENRIKSLTNELDKLSKTVDEKKKLVKPNPQSTPTTNLDPKNNNNNSQKPGSTAVNITMAAGLKSEIDAALKVYSEFDTNKKYTASQTSHRDIGQYIDTIITQLNSHLITFNKFNTISNKYFSKEVIDKAKEYNNKKSQIELHVKFFEMLKTRHNEITKLIADFDKKTSSFDKLKLGETNYEEFKELKENFKKFNFGYYYRIKDYKTLYDLLDNINMDIRKILNSKTNSNVVDANSKALGAAVTQYERAFSEIHINSTQWDNQIVQFMDVNKKIKAFADKL